MGERTNISWCDSTWNPWQGCTNVSPGCDHCYAETLAARWGKDFTTLRRSAPTTFKAPLRWKEPKLIFTCSISDFFHRQADPWREEAWEVIAATPHHTYQILTKRPGLMVAWAKSHGWPANVWAGTSVESQKYAPRLEVLARVQAKVRFVSVEPLLGPVDLTPYFFKCSGCVPTPEDPRCTCKGLAINWVIVGGESGPGARPMQPDWARSLRDECQKVGIPYFLKQLGGFKPGGPALLDGREWREMPPVGKA